MWTCPKCDRNFKTNKQSHICSNIEIGELFEGKPDDLVLAFDDILLGVSHWEPNTVGTAKHSIVFTSKKAWLIIRPMKSELDVKFYTAQPLESDKIKKITEYHNKYAHHIRIKMPEQISPEIFKLLRVGFDYSLK